MKNLLKNYYLLILIAIAVACKDDDEVSNGNNRPSAEAGDDVTVTLGTRVDLDGGASSDPDGQALTYDWEITSQPGTSTVGISNNQQEQVQFTPDVAGVYIVTLTVSDDDPTDASDDDTSLEATDEVVVTVEEASEQTVIIENNISENTTWVDINEDPSIPDYRVVNSISVSAALTIDPGVVVEFDEDVNLYIAAGGSLIADGEAANKIIMTSSNVSAGTLWKGIEIVSTLSQNSLTNVEISYAGGAEYTSFADFVDVPAGIAIHGGGRLNINSTAITNSGGYGMYIRNGELLSFSENDFQDNTNAGLGLSLTQATNLDGLTTFTNNQFAVEIFGSTISETNETTLPKLNGSAVYYVSGDLNITSVINIEAGSSFALAEDVNVFVDTEGTLKAIGTASERIIMNSSNPGSGILWKGIEIISTSSLNEISYVDITNAGGAEYTSFADFVDVPASIALRGGGALRLTNSNISSSGGYGTYIRYGVLNAFENNDFSNNSNAGLGLDLAQATMIDNQSTFSGNQHAVEIYGSTIDATGEFTLSSLSNSSIYYVSGDLSINTFLNIEEGSSLNMAEDVNIFVDANGVLKAVGTDVNMITFNSVNSGSGILWKGIEIISTNVQNELTYCDISFAGNSNYTSLADFVDVPASIALRSQAKLRLTNTEISNSGGYGVYIRYGVFDNFASNTFADNTLAHVGLPANEASSMDVATTFAGNSYAVEVFGDIDSENTWVNLDGPSKYHVVEDVTINAGLILNAGVEIDFDEDLNFDVRSTGYLSAEGTAGNTVNFNSSNVAGQIAWGGINFYTADARNILNFVTINLAGGIGTTDLDSFIDVGASVAGNGNARLTLTNSTISNTDAADKSNTDDGDGYGVYFQGTINDIAGVAANNTFTNNPLGNVF